MLCIVVFPHTILKFTVAGIPTAAHEDDPMRYLSASLLLLVCFCNQSIATETSSQLNLLQPVSALFAEEIKASEQTNSPPFPLVTSSPSCCGLEEPEPTMIGGSVFGLSRPLGAGLTTFYPYSAMSRVADNNSTIPQDRVWYSYEFVNDYILHRGLDDIGNQNRDFQFHEVGIETLLWNPNLSAELIVPFSYASSSTYGISELSTGRIQNEVEMEKLAFGLKALLYGREDLALSTGLRVEAPTSEPLELTPADGEWEKDAWAFTPYLAVLLKPKPNVFIQSFLAYRMAADDELAGTVIATREPNYFQADAQFGFWLMRNPHRRGLTGLQWKSEVNYTATFEEYSPTTLHAAEVGEVDMLNVSNGLTAIINNQWTVTTAFVVPVRDGSNATVYFSQIPSDRQFDYQFTLQVNYFLGAGN